MIGDGRPHHAALIVLDPPQLADDPNARTIVDYAIAQVNHTRDPREQIEIHTILRDPWLPGDELTETLKLRRQHINEKHADTIEQLYHS